MAAWFPDQCGPTFVAFLSLFVPGKGDSHVHILGLDIGGANIKAATFDGVSECIPFAFWKNPDGLVAALQELSLLEGQRPAMVGLTMTAELADCFETRAQGVEFVIRKVLEVFPDCPVRVWMTSGEFAEPDDAIDLWTLTAAANWHALATWAGRAVPKGPALLVDIGSTTTDVIPLVDGLPLPDGLNDLQRLANNELVYSGVRRTPVCAIVPCVPLEDPSIGVKEVHVPLAAELFATAADVHVINGDIPEDAEDCDTADNRPLTRHYSLNRLAHQLCCDSTDLSEAQLTGIAAYVGEQQLQQIQTAIENRLTAVRKKCDVPKDEPVRILISGSGSWLAERAFSQMDSQGIHSVSDLSAMFVRNVSTCAAAFAVARLVSERCSDDLLPWSQL